MRPDRIALSFASLLCAGGLRAQQIGGRSLEDWRALILPGPEECSWEAIPWRPTFWSAVCEAQERERPILLWAMNGHPLGCT